MKKIFKLCCLAVSISMILCLFASCGKSNGNSNSGKEDMANVDYSNTKIVMFAACDSEATQIAFDEAADKWEEEVGGKASYIYGTDWNQRYTKLTTLIATGEQLDFYHSGSNIDIPVLPVKGMVLPVDEYLEDTDEISVDLSKRAFSFNGHVYGFGLKFANKPYMIIYNKTIFENNGVKTPAECYNEGNWTWDTFREAAKSLTQDLNNDGVTDQYGYGSWLPHLFMQTAGVSDYIDSDYKLNLDNPLIAKTAQFVQQCGFKDKSIVPGIWDWIDSFIAGSCAMIGERNTYLQYSLEHGLTDEVDIAPFPQDPDNNSNVKYGISTDGFCLLGNTKNAAATVKFIKEYYAPALAKANQQEIEDSDVWNGYTDEQQKMIDEVIPDAYCLNSFGFNNFGEIQRTMWQKIYGNGESISSVFASYKPQLQAELDTCLADTNVDGIEKFNGIDKIDFENGMSPIVENTSGCAKLEGKISGNKSLTVTCPETESGKNPPVLIRTDNTAAKLPSGHNYSISIKYSLSEELSGYDTVYFQIRSLAEIDDYDAGTSDTLVLDSNSKKTGTLQGEINLPVSTDANDYVLVMSYTGNGGKVIIDDITIKE